jgi:hypothetical protein
MHRTSRASSHRRPLFAALLDAGVDQIRQSASANVAVTIRLLEALGCAPEIVSSRDQLQASIDPSLLHAAYRRVCVRPFGILRVRIRRQ